MHFVMFMILIMVSNCQKTSDSMKQDLSKSYSMKSNMAARGSFTCYVCGDGLGEDGYICPLGSTKEIWGKQPCTGSCTLVKNTNHETFDVQRYCDPKKQESKCEWVGEFYVSV